MLTLTRQHLPGPAVDAVVKAFGTISSGVCVLHYLYSLLTNKIPSRVPIQFGFNGEVNLWSGYGRAVFALFPILSAVYPFRHHTGWGRINYPWEITPQNKEVQKFHAESLLYDISLGLSTFLPFLQYYALEVARGSMSALPGWLVPSFLTSLVLPTLTYFYVSYKAQ